ncbi:MAG: type II toxin-antitoxin system VapC family toxin [Acidobacteria bacterium]|nr:type II toxin-antitoxin system VapC family toxin [Acidobacteriota bacterium]
MLVLDASAALAACLAQDGFDRLSGEELVAPPLLWSEVPSVLHEQVWRRAVPEPVARAALERLIEAPVSPKRPAGLLREAWRVADELGWAKTYDAEYVALARLQRCPLLTLDGRLRRGASRFVEVLGPTQLGRRRPPR